MNAAELYELLDRLPYACDDFIVRFTTRDRADLIEPDDWFCDDDEDLILCSNEDANINEKMDVEQLKKLLNGDNNDWCDYGDEVYNDSIVYIRNDEDEDGEIDNYAWEPTFDRFSINWKRKRVDIWME